MINIKTIIKAVLIALFICVCSVDSVYAQTPPVSNTDQDPTFCGASDGGVFEELVMTGQKIFNRLRDLIYVVAGFGIIGVAVGGFFGNMNWKWLGAIVISLVVIASAGELVILLTGCEQYGTDLITNTLEAPAPATEAVEP
ncbi:MAG: TrbC/VirB2 family protein [Alphaproteobacteria bacterium]|nr:TrbC/VirB2 family protein [Alphaproteobacteria bacterium]